MVSRATTLTIQTKTAINPTAARNPIGTARPFILPMRRVGFSQFNPAPFPMGWEGKVQGGFGFFMPTP